MDNRETVVRQSSGPGGRWWLAVLLALLILIIAAIAYLVTHPHPFGLGANPTATPTTAPTAVPATPTPAAGPTGTPVPGPTGTPAPGPTATPGSGPTATPGTTGVKTGQITHPQAQIKYIQQQATAGNSQYTYYLDPIQVVQNNLSAYGFAKGQYTIVKPQPSPAASPTAYANKIGLPQVRVIVQYSGQQYGIFLDQPVNQGQGGIWVIIAIWPCSGTTYCT